MQEVEGSGPVMVKQETSDVVVCLAYHLSVFGVLQISILHVH